MRRSVTESLLLVTMLYFVMPNFVLDGRQLFVRAQDELCNNLTDRGN